MSSSIKSIPLSDLPKLGSALDGGIFAGITTQPDGAHSAVVLLPGRQSEITWSVATEWAENQGGELPSRPIFSLLYANVKASLPSGWHWTSETHKEDASCAWGCSFDYGYISGYHKSYEGSAVAVRLIPLIA